jgi:hypothetical protein
LERHREREREREGGGGGWSLAPPKWGPTSVTVRFASLF